MPQVVPVLIHRRSERARLSKANLRLELTVDEADMLSIVEALGDSLRLGEPGHGARTLLGLQSDLALYERLYRLAFGHPPDPKLCEELVAAFGPGEFARVAEAARTRWTV